MEGHFVRQEFVMSDPLTEFQIILTQKSLSAACRMDYLAKAIAILFGGRNELVGSELAETVVLRFGRSYKRYSLNNLIYSQHCHQLCGVHVCLIREYASTPYIGMTQSSH